jgi:hypothetical protein
MAVLSDGESGDHRGQFGKHVARTERSRSATKKDREDIQVW